VGRQAHRIAGPIAAGGAALIAIPLISSDLQVSDADLDPIITLLLQCMLMFIHSRHPKERTTIRALRDPIRWIHVDFDCDLLIS